MESLWRYMLVIMVIVEFVSKNVAYSATAITSSTVENNIASNAVDEDPWTYALTETGEYPKLAIALTKMYTVKYIYSIIQEDYDRKFNVYVMNQTQTTFSDINLCSSFIATGTRNTRTIICTKTLTGDRIVIIADSTYARLLIYEIQVYECSQGTFGNLCNLECRNCEDNKCAQNTGFCTIGCKPGWYGDKCNEQCPSKCESPCHRSLGCTNCQIGFNGPDCDQCYGNTYGRNCSLTCQNCIDCDNVYGCRECLNGFYGDICHLSCPNQCKNKKCLRQSGFCLDGCQDGYTGMKCETSCTENCVTCNATNLCISCSNGRFGTNCEYRCPETCGGSKTCDKNNGVCSYECYQNCFNCTKTYNCETCKPGFYGSWCNNNCLSRCLTCDSRDSCTSCKEGWSGQLCQCSEHCEYEDCDDNGICQGGCKGSYHGERCDDVPCPSKNCQRCEQLSGNCTECSEGLYGINCTEKCNGSCLGTTCDMTGACLKGCVDGFAGIFCTKCE